MEKQLHEKWLILNKNLRSKLKVTSRREKKIIVEYNKRNCNT